MNRKTDEISKNNLRDLRDIISESTGIFFPEEKWSELQYRLSKAAVEFGFEEKESFVKWILSASLTRRQIETLAGCITIGETYFFRHKAVFDVFEKVILPKIINSQTRKDKYLRIWSAGCSSGEEAYSIAIIVGRMLDLKKWNVAVMATDINPHFIRKGTEAIYRDWSFREVPEEIKKRYFVDKGDGKFQLLPHIKKLVNFSYLNLVEDNFPSILNNTNAVDVIFCRNVIMYFNKEKRDKIIKKLYNSLVDGGWLIVSPVETSLFVDSEFEGISYGDVIVFGKCDNNIKFIRNGALDNMHNSAKKKASVSSMDLEPGINAETKKVTVKNDADILANFIGDENGSNAHFKIAEQLYQQGLYGESSQILRKILNIDGNNLNAISLLARNYANLGKLSDAIEMCERGIAADKLNPAIYYLHAAILQELGFLEEARISLKKVLYLDPDYVAALFSLGMISHQMENESESRRYFKNALNLLSDYNSDYSFPEFEGITAETLIEIINTAISIESKEALS